MTKKFIILFISAILLAGCGSKKSTVKNYYLIELGKEYRAASAIDSLPLIDAWCEIADIRISPAYATRDIALRSDSHQIQYFENHEWAVRPHEAILFMVIDFLKEEHLFKRVSDRFWQVIPTYQIQTNIHNIEVIQDGKDFIAHLNMEFILLDIAADKIVLTHTGVRESTLENRELNLLASTISHLIYEELNEFSDKIKHQFRE